MSYRTRISRLMGLTALSFAFSFGIAGAPALAQEETVVLSGGRLLTMTDGVIENGVLVMRGGRITAIGSRVRIPSDARVIDVTGKTVMPGLIDGFTNLGAADYPSYGEDDDEATDPVTPHLRIIDALNPDNRFIPLARSAGVTAVLCAPAEGNLLTGQSALVRLAGTSVEEMVVRSPVGVHISLGEASKLRYGEKRRMPATRMGSAALLRQTLVDAQGYADKLAEHERKLAAHEAGEEEDGEGGDKPTTPARNLKLEALLPVLSGEVPLIVGADRFDDIHSALRIAAEFHVRIVLNHGAEAHRLAEELAGQDIPVIWGPVGARYRELESQEGTPETTGRLYAAGVRFAFQTGSIENVVGLLDQARAAVVHGRPREEALKGLTLYPAEVFGVAEELGSLEVGKWADVVVFDGDPLSELSKAEMVFVGGRRY
ncbi:MAG: amidohydrolase family protein [Gemmatimonadetes bacterium]|nr:amidohydrolase family protein [Gemmatimonadota bacterium]